MLDVEFRDNLSRYRAANGARTMAVAKPTKLRLAWALVSSALKLVRADPPKDSVKTKRKSAGWSSASLNEILGFNQR